MFPTLQPVVIAGELSTLSLLETTSPPGLGHQAIGKATQNDALSCQLYPAAVRAVA